MFTMLFGLFLCLVIIGFSIYYWPKELRDLKTILITAGLVSAVIMTSIIIARLMPIKETKVVVQTIQKKYVDPPKIVYKDRIVYRAPDGEVGPVDVKAACAGKVPLQLVKIDEQTERLSDEDKEAGKKAESTTWILAHPIGSKVLIACGQPGAYASFWNVGDVIQIVRGVPQ